MRHLLEGTLRNKEIVYVSDAGSPIVSDPGVDLVALVREMGGEVDTIPGPSAVIAALELSGLPSIPFHFHGFVARKKGDLEKFFIQLFKVKGTHIFFESPNRVQETARTFLQLPGHPDFVVCREITKLYQQTYCLKDLAQLEQAQNLDRGELVCLFHVTEEHNAKDEELMAMAQEVVDSGAQLKVLSKLLGKILDRPSKEIYQYIVQAKD
jgi:16S rRNA (cytidine1402-2'-O)-methyltransferase